jgi:hypothetical protein
MTKMGDFYSEAAQRRLDELEADRSELLAGLSRAKANYDQDGAATMIQGLADLDRAKQIGAALHIGKTHALRASGSDFAWGSTYSRQFNKWMSERGFGAMRPSDRSYAVALHENLPAIEQWRATLPDKERRRLRGAQQNVKRWKASLVNGNGKCPADLGREAIAAWRRFVACVEALPAGDAMPLWQVVLAQAAAVLGAPQTFEMRDPGSVWLGRDMPGPPCA